MHELPAASIEKGNSIHDGVPSIHVHVCDCYSGTCMKNCSIAYSLVDSDFFAMPQSFPQAKLFKIDLKCRKKAIDMPFENFFTDFFTSLWKTFRLFLWKNRG